MAACVDVRGVPRAAARDGRDVDRLDPRAIADQLVDRQAVDDEAAERPDDRAGGLEPQREHADEEVARGGQLGVADRRLAHPGQLGEHVEDGRDRDLGVDRRPGRERPGAAAQVEAGAGAVRVALLLAQLHVQPRVEQAAEDRAHDRDRVEVRDPPRQPAMADPDLGLDRARPMDRPGRAARPTCRCRRSARPAASGPAGRPTRRTGARPSADDVQAAEVAADDERRPGRVEAALVGAAQVVRRRGPRRSRGSRPPAGGTARPARRSSPTKASSARRRGSALAWSRSFSRSSRRRSTSAAGKVGRRTTSARSSSAGGEPVGRDVHADGQRVPAGLGVERRAEALGGLDQGDRVVAARCPPSAPGPPGRSPRPASAGSSDRAARRARATPRRAAGRAGPRRGCAARSASRCSVDRRELVRSRRARDRSLGDDRAVAPRIDRRASCRHLLVGVGRRSRRPAA